MRHLSILFLVSGLPVVVGCAESVPQLEAPAVAPILPADAVRMCTRAYKAPCPTVLNATVVALKALGFEIVLADTAGGRVKTAPKVMNSFAESRIDGPRHNPTAHVSQVTEALAWSLEAVPSGDGCRLVGRPRAFENGTQSVAAFSPMFLIGASGSLFREIESELRGGAGR
jgi:hypothetical protein